MSRGTTSRWYTWTYCLVLKATAVPVKNSLHTYDGGTPITTMTNNTSNLRVKPVSLKETADTALTERPRKSYRSVKKRHKSSIEGPIAPRPRTASDHPENTMPETSTVTTTSRTKITLVAVTRY